jgi:SAM-dependent methyltransferase
MQALTEANYECAGADVSEEMLQLARRRGLQVRHGSADALPFDSESFDLAVSVATFHHLISPVVVAGAIREMARVLRPGGALLIWDHNPLNPYWRVLMARLPQDQGDERLVPARELTVGLAAAGLAEIRLQRITFMPDFTPAWGVPAVAASERLLERIPGIGLFAAHNVATANKPGAVHA